VSVQVSAARASVPPITATTVAPQAVTIARHAERRRGFGPARAHTGRLLRFMRDPPTDHEAATTVSEHTRADTAPGGRECRGALSSGPCRPVASPCGPVRGTSRRPSCAASRRGPTAS
jgi:hypothetical protein